MKRVDYQEQKRQAALEGIELRTTDGFEIDEVETTGKGRATLTVTGTCAIEVGGAEAAGSFSSAEFAICMPA